jgi:HEAT repeat protein
MRPFAVSSATALVLLIQIVPLSPAVPLTGPQPADDERLLESVGLSTRGSDLLAFVRKLTTPTRRALRPEQAAALLGRLGDREFKVREAAANELVRHGPAALPALEKARADRDPEVRRAVGQCIERIRQVRGGLVAIAAARLLRTRRPPGMTAVLLDYLPFVENEVVEIEVLHTLLDPGVRAGKVDPALLTAMKSGVAAKRAGAALVLGRIGDAGQRDQVVKLLSDPDPKVRLRAVQGLWPTRDKHLIPVLIALLAEESPSIAEQAEDLLVRAAGDRAVSVALGDGPRARRRCQRSWEAWWKTHEATLDLDRPELDTRAFNPALRVREVSQQFLAALRDGDTATIRDQTDVPFIVRGVEGLTHRDELDHFLSELRREMLQQPQLKPAVRQVVRLEEYARVAPPREQKILAALRDSETHAVVYVSEVRVVHVRLPRQGRLEDLALFVRIANGRLWLMGLGEAQLPEPPEK